eukprot:m.108208 g.108208  ORF g.108208 m.108208 type:complete len:58 (-) comp15209_c2_seq1:3810-3983(-)
MSKHKQKIGQTKRKSLFLVKSFKLSSCLDREESQSGTSCGLLHRIIHKDKPSCQDPR